MSAAAPAARAHRSAIRRLGIAGGLLLGAVVFLAVFAPVIAGHPPDAASGRPYEPPSTGHLLGTDDVGHDLFAQLLFGARISLTIGLLSALVAVSVGLTVGLVAGYQGGRTDRVLMRLVDLTIAFPFLVLVLVLAAFFGRGLATTVTVLAAVLWARPARVLRSQVLKLRQLGHVTAARAMGATTPRILGRHVLPRVAPLAVAQFVRAANVSVLLEASLSFLGLGDPNRMSWGATLYFANARNAFLTDAWTWWIVPPGLALTTTVLGLAFLGFAVEEWADPRLARTAPRHPVRRRKGTGRPAAAPAVWEPGDPVLAVRQLSVEYRTATGTVRAVDNVGFDVGRGRLVGLVGESGSGKSTIAMAVMGLLRAPARVEGGEIRLRGRDLRTLSRAALQQVRGRDVALIPQSAMNALNPAYTIHRQVAEAAARTRDRQAAAARAAELLEVVGIPPPRHGSYPHELSGGMRQRVVIAMALANDPCLVVADEPVSGLDVVTQARILRLLLDLKDRFGLSVLLISHDLPTVARIADDLLVMYGGRIVEDGATKLVTDRPAHPYTQRLLQSFPSLRGPKRPLASIPGEPPADGWPGCGCPFAPRCPVALEACACVDPPPLEVGAGHRVACLLEGAAR